MKKTVGFLVLGLVLTAQAALADRGSIPFDPHVRIFEPNQRAMIAWNGAEEILLLSTDLRASAPTKVLEVIPLPSEPKVTEGDEVIPLPSEPKVTEGDVEVFRKATELINRKLAPVFALGRGDKGRMAGEGARPAAELTFHEKIGAHDISVIRMLDRQGFIRWVNDYLKRAGVANPSVPPPLAAVIDEYLRDDYKWFVFDVIELGEKTVTNDAIQYRFRSNCVYYPLRITRTEEGHTSIRLLILTPRLLSNFPGLPVSRVRLAHQPVSITSGELRSLNEDMDSLLGHRSDMKLRIWNIEGQLPDFDADLIAR